MHYFVRTFLFYSYDAVCSLLFPWVSVHTELAVRAIRSRSRNIISAFLHQSPAHAYTIRALKLAFEHFAYEVMHIIAEGTRTIILFYLQSISIQLTKINADNILIFTAIKFSPRIYRKFGEVIVRSGRVVFSFGDVSHGLAALHTILRSVLPQICPYFVVPGAGNEAVIEVLHVVPGDSEGKAGRVRVLQVEVALRVVYGGARALCVLYEVIFTPVAHGRTPFHSYWGQVIQRPTPAALDYFGEPFRAAETVHHFRGRQIDLAVAYLHAYYCFIIYHFYYLIYAL